ncbi:MAG: TonB-dependent receptor [Nibricoccus sp.]
MLRKHAIFVTALAALSQSSYAQNKPSSTNNEEDIVTLTTFQVTTNKDNGYRASNSVSGSRIDTPIKDLPFALQAFTQDFISDQHPTNIFDVTKFSPGVTYRSNDFAEGNANLAIRGFAIGSAGNSMLLRDGFRGPSVLDFTNVARMEVVKGPASFLYGQVAPGGIVNVITKTPQDKFGATVSAEYGSYNQYRSTVDVTGPIQKDLLYRAAYSYNHDIEYWKPYEANQSDFAPQLLWKPNSSATLSVKYETYRKEETPPVFQKPGWGYSNGVIPTATDPNYSGVDVPGLPSNWNSMADSDYRISKDDSVLATLDLKANDNWVARASYSFDRNTVDMVFSGNLGVTNGSYIQGRRWRGVTYKTTSNTFEGQLVGTYKFGRSSLRLLLGSQFNPYKFKNWQAQIANSSSPSYSPASPLPPWDLRDPSTWNRVIPMSFTHDQMTSNATSSITRSTDSALYGGATVGFLDDRIMLLLGVRATTSVSQTNDLLTNVAGQEFTTKKSTPQLGLLYKVTSGISAFASYSESFVPNARVLQSVDKSSSAWRQIIVGPAAPTLGKGYDVGIKTDLFGGKISSTLALYDVQQTNIINDIAEFNSATGSQFITNIQSGKQESKGVELDVVYSVTNNWQIYASGSVMDAKIVYLYTKTIDDYYLSVSDYTTLDTSGQANYKNVIRYHGRPLQMSAPRQYNLWTRYGFTGVLKGFYVAGGANYTGDQTLLPDTPSWAHQTYTLWSGLVGYTTKLFGHETKFELNGKNLTNEYYRPSQSSRCRPREFVLSASTKF